MAQATKQGTAESTEIVKAGLSTDALAGITDFESAINAVRDSFPAARIATADELGDGFTLLKDKDALIGLPIMFVGWTFSEGDFGEFVSARCVVKFPGNTFVKYVINDGSTGICEMLRNLTDKDEEARILYAEKGLRKSMYTGPDGKPATTYYIDTSKATVNA